MQSITVFIHMFIHRMWTSQTGLSGYARISVIYGTVTSNQQTAALRCNQLFAVLFAARYATLWTPLQQYAYLTSLDWFAGSDILS